MINKIIKNSLLKSTMIYTVATIINSAIPFLLLPILTRYLSAEEYGIVSMFTLLVTFTAPFIGLNVNGAISRQYYNQEEVDIDQYVGTSFIILLISTLIVALIFYFFAQPLSNLTSFPIKLLWIVVIYCLAQFIGNIILSLYRVKKMAYHYSFFKISSTLMNFIISIFFVVGLGWTWKGRIFGQFLSMIIFAVGSVIVLFKKKWIRVKFNRNYFYNALNFGVPLVPHALSSSIITMTDRIFITNMVGLSTTGVYTVGYQIGSVINIIASSFNNAYVPWLYEKLKQNNTSTKLKIVKFTYLYFGSILLLSIGLGLISPYILSRFLGENFGGASIFVIWVASGYAFNGMYLMVVNYIFYAQKTKYLAGITFLTSIINIGLNYILIKSYGAIGAAQATTITFAIKFVLIWLVATKVHHMPWKQVFMRRY